MRSTGRSFRAAVFRMASGVGASQTQKVFVRSSLTYEWTHVTPSSAFCSTMSRVLLSPSPTDSSPAEKVRSTTYRGIDQTVGRDRTRAHRPDYLCCAGALPILGGEAQAQGLCARLDTRAHVELAEDRSHVVVHGSFREHETVGDLGVAKPFGDEPEHLAFPRCQTAGILSGCRARSADQTPDSPLTKTTRNDCRSRLRTEPLQLVVRPPKRVLLIRLGECERGFVGRAELAPELGGSIWIPRKLARIRLRRIRRRLKSESGPPPPHGESTAEPACAALDGHSQRHVSRVTQCIHV